MHAAYVRPSHVRVIMSRERVDGLGGWCGGGLRGVEVGSTRGEDLKLGGWGFGDR